MPFFRDGVSFRSRPTFILLSAIFPAASCRLLSRHRRRRRQPCCHSSARPPGFTPFLRCPYFATPFARPRECASMSLPLRRRQPAAPGFDVAMRSALLTRAAPRPPALSQRCFSRYFSRCPRRCYASHAPCPRMLMPPSVSRLPPAERPRRARCTAPMAFFAAATLCCHAFFAGRRSS